MGIKATNKVNEYAYHSLVKEALERQFTNKGYSVDFEVTGHKGRPKVPERFLVKNYKLLEWVSKFPPRVREVPTPDVMGFVWKGAEHNRSLVVAEFKVEPKFEDVFKTKGYDELFNSDFAFLVSAKPISQSSTSTMLFIQNNTQLLKTKAGKSSIRIRFLHRTPEGAITLAVLGSELELLLDEDT